MWACKDSVCDNKTLKSLWDENATEMQSQITCLNHIKIQTWDAAMWNVRAENTKQLSATIIICPKGQEPDLF